jgi:hypothetical protein
MFIQWLRPHYAEDGGADGGERDTSDAGNPPADARPKPSDLLARYGKDGDAALRMAERLSAVLEDNFKAREKNRQLRDEVAGLRGKAAPEGAVVLSADEAKRWEAYQGLGVEPAAIKAALAERDEARGSLAKLEREKVLRDVADVAGYKPSVLGQLPGSADLAFEIRTVTQDGKSERAVYVKADGKDVPLTEYAQQQWADFRPALRIEQQAATGTRYVEQSAGGKPPAPQDMVSKRLEQQAERRKAQTNPLMKLRTT